MTKENNNPDTNNADQNEMALTDILQAHDILLSILLGKSLAKSKNPLEVIDQITQMVEIQDINPAAKEHIKLLLSPLKDTLK